MLDNFGQIYSCEGRLLHMTKENVSNSWSPYNYFILVSNCTEGVVHLVYGNSTYAFSFNDEC